MAITFSLSAKPDNLGYREILIRYKSGSFAARTKSGVYSFPDWFNFVIGDNSETPFKGRKIITKEMEQIQTYHENQKIQLSEINTAITEVLRDTELDRNNSKWLVSCLDKYYLRGEYAPKEKEAPEVKTLFQFVDRFIAEAPNRKDKQTGRSHKETNIQQYKAGIKHLKAFAETKKKRDFTFEESKSKF